MIHSNDMVRAFAYSLVGVLLGATIGFGTALFLSGPQIPSWTIIGAVAGVVIGLALAHYVTSRGLLTGFATKQQADAVAYAATLDMRGWLPMSLADKLGERFRAYLESRADTSGE